MSAAPDITGAALAYIYGMKFIKMQAAGNDYVYVDGDENRTTDFSFLSRKISDRRFGVGSDGIITVSVDKSGKSDFFMHIFNADGSEGATCGNGLRCSAVFAYLTGKTPKKTMTIRTISAIHTVRIEELGADFFASADFPLPHFREISTEEERLLKGVIRNGKTTFSAVDNGNLHAVFFNAEQTAESLAGKLSRAGIFNGNANTESATISGNSIICDVFERGSGTTFSCGSGAVATAFAAKEKTGLNLKNYPIKMRGGTLFVEFDDKKSYLSGTVTPIFNGVLFSRGRLSDDV